ncbi:MobA/MobL family protein [Xanthomonas melonis]|uniref:Plasmid mobilization protein n=1 Tax=Xanthomonas melonis TaxID=56456 RepID=A0A2S7DBS2_9XANT|nr:MobA/MobL family protein [Xanthomonas melonis]MCC4601600.1 MobA/MobL family protein [Xanthomonas melonis]PPU71276.1 plasmid mobilization protein [Xanthomonas melonis]
MASFHFELKSGRNGYEHACYVARHGFHNKRGDLIASGYGNLPAWAEGDPHTLWKAAEKFERKNGSVYREAIIALPAELNFEQNQALMKEIVSKLASGKPYQVAMHAPKSSLEGEFNPHLHLMTSDRMDDGIERPAERFFSRYNAMDPEKGGRKKAGGGRNRMQLRDEMISKRKMVADTINHHLALHGHETRVDHRNLKDQGLVRKAERHLGPARIRGMSPSEKSSYVSLRRKLSGT